jgi:hypothetical protein
MLKTRNIKPGIVLNETLAALGYEATLMFERLWMLADREGRLEDRPMRIRAEVFPYWPDFPVEKSLEKLAEAGFIHRYTVNDMSPQMKIIYIQRFTMHQNPHPHEKASLLPAPRNAIACNDMPCNVGLSYISYKGSVDKEPNGSLPTQPFAHGRDGAGSDGPEPNGPSGAGAGGGKKHTRTERTPPKTAKANAPDKPKAEAAPAIPHPEGFDLMRSSLHALAGELHLPPPGDALVLAVLDAAQGAAAEAIHAALKAAFFRGRFRGVRSLGVVPHVVRDLFLVPKAG